MIKPIDLKEEFPHLFKAPIVEAVLDIRVVPSVQWEETTLRDELKKCLPDFPKVEALRGAMVQIIPPGQPGAPTFEDFGCVGLKYTSSDNLHIAQFNKGAFVVSRLKPYENWGEFSKEALRLWAIYCNLLKPKDIKRIGLRFINRIDIMQTTIELGDYYKYPPEPVRELGWPLNGYLHHDVIQVPETLYSVNLIKTVQNNIPGKIGLILDIDVFMPKQFEFNELRIIECLEEMCWVKNKIFFNNLTQKLIEELK